MGGIIFWKRPILGVAVSGMVLSIAAYFRLQDTHLVEMVECLSRYQASDGSWQDAVEDVARKPFHITIAVPEGLPEYQQTLATPDVAVSTQPGRLILTAAGFCRIDIQARHTLNLNLSASPTAGTPCVPCRCDDIFKRI